MTNLFDNFTIYPASVYFLLPQFPLVFAIRYLSIPPFTFSSSPLPSPLSSCPSSYFTILFLTTPSLPPSRRHLDGPLVRLRAHCLAVIIVHRVYDYSTGTITYHEIYSRPVRILSHWIPSPGEFLVFHFEDPWSNFTRVQRIITFISIPLNPLP